jgi:hypothetical protein
LVDTARRDEIRHLIGGRAEEIVWAFCTLQMRAKAFDFSHAMRQPRLAGEQGGVSLVRTGSALVRSDQGRMCKFAGAACPAGIPVDWTSCSKRSESWDAEGFPV